MKKKIYLGFAIFIIVVLVACGIKYFTTQNTQPNETYEEETGISTQEIVDYQLSSEQTSLIEQYGDEENQVLELLTSNVWAENTNTITFDRAGFTVHQNDSETKYSFAIKEAKNETIKGSNNEYTERWTLVSNINGQETLVTLDRFHPASGAIQEWAFTCDLINYGAVFSRIESSAEFKVLGITDEFTNLVGGSEITNALQTSINEWCASNAPTASSATLNSTVEIDFNTKTYRYTFSLDDSTLTEITVIQSMVDNSFDIGRV